MDLSILLHIFFVFLIAIGTNAIAYYYGFFSFKSQKRPSTITILHVVVLILFYIVIPTIFFFLMFPLQIWNPNFSPWVGVGSIYLSTIGIGAFQVYFGCDIGKRVWNPNGVSNVGSLFFGFLSWLIVFPWVQLITLVSHALMEFYLGEELPRFEQDIASQIREVSLNPLLFGATILMIAVLVPILEEILFRGFLQNWLSGLMPLVISIPLTSLIFASLHLSYTQGLGNIQIFTALFILSCFLGFFYEKKGNLFAPIGLHMAVNSVSMIALSFLD